MKAWLMRMFPFSPLQVVRRVADTRIQHALSQTAPKPLPRISPDPDLEAARTIIREMDQELAVYSARYRDDDR
jgi:hypothetical protein